MHLGVGHDFDDGYQTCMNFLNGPSLALSSSSVTVQRDVMLGLCSSTGGERQGGKYDGICVEVGGARRIKAISSKCTFWRAPAKQRTAARVIHYDVLLADRYDWTAG